MWKNKKENGGFMKKLWFIAILLMVLSLNLIADDVITTGTIMATILLMLFDLVECVLYTAEKLATGNINGGKSVQQVLLYNQ